MASDQQVDDETKPCPACGEQIKSVAVKCRFCGTNLDEFAASHETGTEKLLFEGRPAIIYSAWQWLAVIFTLGIAFIYYWWQSIGIKYKITTQRIKLERGIFSTTMDSVELFTIEHFDVQKPLGMRLAGYCRLQLRSSDSSFQSVAIYGIKDLDTMADALRECSLRERTRRRITSIIQP